MNEPQGILGPITTIPHAGQINALSTLNLRPAARKTWGFDDRKARSLTDRADGARNMPDALEVAAAQDRQFKQTGRLVGPLHGVVMAIKDQYDTFDMRTTSGADAQYANDRPPDDATFVKRLRDAGAIILAKANMAEYATDGARSSFGGTFCNPYDTERAPGMSSAGSATSVAANLVTCAIAEETVVSIRWPAAVNNIVGLAPTQELVSRDGMMGAGLNTRVGPVCRTVQDAAKVLDVIAGYDPKDELTVFSVGRTPAQPYASFAMARRLDGMRIGVIREYMNKKLFSKADEESIDIVERALGDLRKLGATVVDPGPEGALFQSCVTRYAPQLFNAAFAAQRRNLFPVNAAGEPGGSHRHAAGHGGRTGAGARRPVDPQSRRVRGPGRGQVHDQQVPARARRREHQEQRRSDQQGDLLSGSELPGPQAEARKHRAPAGARHLGAAAGPVRAAIDRAAVHAGAEARRAGVSPTATIPPPKLNGPREPNVNGRSPIGWSLLGQQGFPVMSVPAGFTTEVWDRVRDGAGTRLVGPIPARLPVGVDFVGRPFDEPMLFRIASAYEAATRHRTPPPGFGALPGEP